jgi:phytoene dehydrogenase-like protein
MVPERSVRMQQKKAVIIGGGIAGLCAGVYLQKNGFETEIIEKHSIAGGLATGWARKGYTFENCVHWLVGSKEGADLNAMWKEVFDIRKLEFFDDEVYQVVEKGSERVVIYKDPHRLERELLEKAPEDAAAIREFARLVRKLAGFKMSGGDSLPARLSALVSMLPVMPVFARYGKRTMKDWVAKYKNPLLREFFGSGLEEMSFLAIAFSLAWMSTGNAGYPIGGSLKMIGLIADRFRELGGKIRFNAEAGRILVENDRAVGIELAGGEKIAADVVVSAADGHATIFDMLGGRYLGDKLKKAYETYTPFPSYVQVSLGVGAGMKNEPGFLLRTLDAPLEIDPETKTGSLSYRIFHFDPTFAPPGKTAVVVFLGTYNDGYWRSLREKDRSKYESEKERVADAVIADFGKRFPAAKDKIEVVDVATPATVVRYTNNWRGSMEGWLITPATGMRPLPKTLPGLSAFYMVGQWTQPGGGLPTGLMNGREVSKLICRDHRMPWRAG